MLTYQTPSPDGRWTRPVGRSQAGDRVVAGAFAYERDAVTAAHLIEHAGITARCLVRPRISESGEVDLVMLQATLDRLADRARVETLVAGAHGAVVDVGQAAACGLPKT